VWVNKFLWLLCQWNVFFFIFLLDETTNDFHFIHVIWFVSFLVYIYASPFIHLVLRWHKKSSESFLLFKNIKFVSSLRDSFIQIEMWRRIIVKFHSFSACTSWQEEDIKWWKWWKWWFRYIFIFFFAQISGREN
jgi:hypothetical protein